MPKKLKIVEKNNSEMTNEELNIKLQSIMKRLNDAYINKKGYEVDKATKEMLDILKPMDNGGYTFYTEMKNHTWQKNQLKIIASISTLMQEYNRMPTNGEISTSAGLSEETIYKHLREFSKHELNTHEWDKYRFMVHRVLTEVFNLGVQGDIRACKVYLDYFPLPSTQQPSEPLIKQTNYIQINNLKLSAEELQSLPIDTQQKIEKLITQPIKIKSKVVSKIEKNSHI